MTTKEPTDHSKKNEQYDLDHDNFWREPGENFVSTIFQLPDLCIEELVDYVCGHSDKVNSNSMNLEATREFVKKISRNLTLSGPGLAIVEKFPVEQFSDSENKRLCRVFSEMIGPLISQDKKQTLLYDVKNRHVADPLRVRKSITNLSQPFHTDGGWLKKPARVIGLFCISNALEGGGSEMTSLLSAFEQLKKEEPQAAKILSEPHPWNKQGEHENCEEAWEMNPLFEGVDNSYIGRYYEDYILTGYDLSKLELKNSTVAALEVLKSKIENQPRFSMTLKAGDFQLVNNWTTVHARKEFQDSDSDYNSSEPDNKKRSVRHLVRVWCD